MAQDRFACRICGNDESNKSHIIREMLLGTKAEFEYIECGKCGTLQIRKIPDNMSEYYPHYYGNFQIAPPIPQNRLLRILSFVKNKQVIFPMRANLLGRSLVELSKFKKIEKYFNYFVPTFDYIDFLNDCNISLDSQILDVGCGSGAALKILQFLGFKHLYGIDPFSEVKIKNIKIWKQDLLGLDTTQNFDLIMLHHSFEHLINPREILEKIKKLLNPAGSCLIRVPIKSDYIWQKYSVYWFQIDAPRHIFLYPESCLVNMFNKVGFRIKKTRYDSTANQFLMSEQYRRGISYSHENSYRINLKRSIFTAQDILNYEKQAIELNDKKAGDQAGFILTL